MITLMVFVCTIVFSSQENYFITFSRGNNTLLCNIRFRTRLRLNPCIVAMRDTADVSDDRRPVESNNCSTHTCRNDQKNRVCPL